MFLLTNIRIPPKNRFELRLPKHFVKRMIESYQRDQAYDFKTSDVRLSRLISEIQIKIDSAKQEYS